MDHGQGIQNTSFTMASHQSQKRQKSKDMFSFSSKFAEALQVPLFARQCAAAVKRNDGCSSSGLEVLRRISKEVGIISTLACEQSYTLRLTDGDQPMLLEAVKLLNSVVSTGAFAEQEQIKLTSLRVLVAGTGRKNYTGYADKLDRFISRLALLVGRVVHLTLQIKSKTNQDRSKPATATGSFFEKLASKFPDLQHLCLGGDIGRPVLVRFAQSCGKLKRLEVLYPGVPLPTLDKLHELLPDLSAFRLQETPSSVTSESECKYIDAVLYKASAIEKLISLGMPSLLLCEVTWNALPHQLRELCVEGFDKWQYHEDDVVFAGHQTLNALQHVTFSLPPGTDLPILYLAATLKLAPGLREVTLGRAGATATLLTTEDKAAATAIAMGQEGPGVSMECNKKLLGSVMLVGKRLTAGLHITGPADLGRYSERPRRPLVLHLHMIDGDDDIQEQFFAGQFDDDHTFAESEICGFLDSLPPCAFFTQLAVTLVPYQYVGPERSVWSDTDSPRSGAMWCGDGDGVWGEWRMGEIVLHSDDECDRMDMDMHAESQTSPPSNDILHSDSTKEQRLHVKHSIPRSVARAFPRLRGLRLSAGVSELGQALQDLSPLTALETLTLTHLKTLRYEMVTGLCKAVPSLRRLNVVRCWLIDNSHLATMQALVVKAKHSSLDVLVVHEGGICGGWGEFHLS